MAKAGAAVAANDQVTTGIDVTVSEAQRDRLAALAPHLRPTEAMSGIATGALQDMADGGVMLNGLVANRIAVALKNRDFTPEEVVVAVEKGVRRFGQAMLIEYALDPIYVTPMEDWSRSNGRTVQELVQDCMQQAFANEWFYSMSFEHRTLAVTAEQYKTIAEALGKDVIFGADIVDLVQKLNEAPELVAAAR